MLFSLLSMRRSGPLTEEELKERRKKHNEVEIRRRQRIKNSFTELGSIIGMNGLGGVSLSVISAHFDVRSEQAVTVSRNASSYPRQSMPSKVCAAAVSAVRTLLTFCFCIVAVYAHYRFRNEDCCAARVNSNHGCSSDD